MRSPHQLLVWFTVLAAAAGFFIRAEEAGEVRCDKSRLVLAPPESSAHRKYAPDREVDLINLALDVTPDFARRTIAAEAVLQFKPIAKPLPELRLDAVGLNVQSVTSSETVQAYDVGEERLVITFKEPVPAGKETTVTIRYWAEPWRGLYFRTPQMGYRDGDTHLFTQGEAIEARHWYPCFDAPNEKFTSEITCRVPGGMSVLSNGRLVSETTEAGTGRIVVHWKQDKPHVNYLISLVAGYFRKVEDQSGRIPLAFYTPPSEIAQAAGSFRDTKDAMDFFEKEIGVPYPWAKYYQVCVNDFVAGGMENTSITTLTDHTLFTPEYENVRTSQGLVAHELAHQWFGDLVTCKDWSHLWLNEGFATYYAHLYDGYKNGSEDMLYGLYQDAKGITERSDDTKPIVYRRYDSPDEQFSYLAYPKGSWVLHMLRSQLGPDLFRACIQTYLERHQYDTVVTEDLNAVIEELSGRSYDRFFDQWVYHAHHPELDVNYSWDEKAKLAKVSVAQSQKLSDSVLLFQFPLTIRFHGESLADRRVIVREKNEDFYFPLPAAPKLVRLDPEFTLLAQVKFSLPEAMIARQLEEKGDVVGRLLAVEQLAGKKTRAAVDLLMRALQNDSFYGVRVEAAQALQRIHSEEAWGALAGSLEQPDARVRHEVIRAMTRFYQPDAYDIAFRQTVTERNPDILAAALHGLGAYPKPEVRDTLIRFLNSESYHNRLAEAAIGAIRSQDDPSLVEPLQAALRAHEARFTSSGFGRGLDALAYLARHQEKKNTVRDFLLGFVNHRKLGVRAAAVRALGTLRDPAAIPILETFASAGKENPLREPAEKAVAALHAEKAPAEEWREVRQEVLELQKENREVKKQLEDLKKRLEASDGRGLEDARKAPGNR